jgi:hypothetical protein
VCNSLDLLFATESKLFGGSVKEGFVITNEFGQRVAIKQLEFEPSEQLYDLFFNYMSQDTLPQLVEVDNMCKNKELVMDFLHLVQGEHENFVVDKKAINTCVNVMVNQANDNGILFEKKIKKL